MICSQSQLEMYHPPKKMMPYTDKNNNRVKHYCQIITGLFQSSSPGVSILWNRDKNAPINMAIVDAALEKYGIPPLAFRRDYKAETKPKSCSYRYTSRQNRKRPARCHGGFKRWQSQPAIMS